jgi:predicted Zn-dependent peptidase
MNPQEIYTHRLDNGLTVVLEPMQDVQSAAFSLLIPSGSVFDPPGDSGTGALLCDLLTRGAGDRDSQQLSFDLDNLGVQRHEGIGTNHLTLTGATLADNLSQALSIYADIVRQPHLPSDQFEAALAGATQALRSAEDDPRQKIMPELSRRCYRAPWGLPSDGTLDELPALSADGIRKQYERCFRPNGAIFGVAGNINPNATLAQIQESFGDWQAKDDPTFDVGERGPAIDHITYDSTQTHIGIAYDAVPYRDPDYYAAWAAVGVLSGGMSSRLFTEVREKRGLCYAISASLSTLKDEARVLCHVGTERPAETLDVTLRELVRIGEGFEQDELDRCKARAKSSLIMQQESTLARSSSIARDWFHLGRVTTLAEVGERINALTVDSVLDYVHSHPAGNFTVMTIGPEAVEVPVEFS